MTRTYKITLTHDGKTFKTTIRADSKEAAETLAKEAYLRRIGVVVSSSEIATENTELEDLFKIFGDIFKF